MPTGGGGPFNDTIETDDRGRGVLLDVFRRCAIVGANEGVLATSGAARPGIAGAAPAGGRGAEGTWGADGCSESDRYEASWFAIYRC